MSGEVVQLVLKSKRECMSVSRCVAHVVNRDGGNPKGNVTSAKIGEPCSCSDLSCTALVAVHTGRYLDLGKLF